MNETASTDRPRDRRIASPSRSSLARWLRGPAGADLLHTEVECIHAAIGNLFGYHCLQVGDLAGADLLSASRIIGHAVIDIDGGAPREPYPLASAGRGGVADRLARGGRRPPAHVLEFEPRPHEVLREASRVLVPEGHLVVLGFNPISVIGLRRVLKPRASVAPWCGTYFGAGRLREWLSLLGFDRRRSAPVLRVGGVLPVPGGPGSRAFVEWMPPALASARLVLAKKRVNAMLPIRPRWRPRRRLAGVGLAGPSVRFADDE